MATAQSKKKQLNLSMSVFCFFYFMTKKEKGENTESALQGLTKEIEPWPQMGLPKKLSHKAHSQFCGSTHEHCMSATRWPGKVG